MSSDGRSRTGGGFAGLERRVWVVSGVIVLGTLMSILDTTIVKVALVTLARRFHTSLSTIQWISTGYLLALATAIPATGWVIERFGAKRVWMLSIVCFVAGSALSGAAWSIGSLERRIAASLGSHASVGSFGTASAAERARVAPHLATAFQQTFWVAAALVAVTVVAALFLPAGAPDRQRAAAGATPAAAREGLQPGERASAAERARPAARP